MDGPTLNSRYNDLLHYLKDAGEFHDPECELCSRDMTNRKVIETTHGFLCTHCADEMKGKPVMKNDVFHWPMKGIYR